MFVVILFIIFYLACVWMISQKYQYQQWFLIAALGMLTLLIGFRDNWPDELPYVLAFQMAPYPWDFFRTATPDIGYAETGYFFLASVVKMIYNSSRFYLLVMGGLSMWLLYKNLDKYCLVPVIGLCDYVARFLLNRDFTQMRSSLAILILIYALIFIQKRKIVPYMLLVLLAYQFHHLSLLGVPLYFFAVYKIPKRYIVLGLLIAVIGSQYLSESIASTVESYSSDFQYTTYVEGGYESGKGMANPMVWFQIGILAIFSFYEHPLAEKYDHYYLFRNTYFYSTLILIFFSQYTALSGRTSTVYATVEMFMLPMILGALSKKLRSLFLLGLGLVFLVFFYTKYNDSMSMIKAGQQQMIQVTQ